MGSRVSNARLRQTLPLCVIVLVSLLVTACSRTPASLSASSGSDWHEFQGTWTAAGSRNILRFGKDRRASTIGTAWLMLVAR
jgi:hypothetical protein